MRNGGTALLDKIGPAIMITHSQGGLGGWLIADARPLLVKGLIQLEPKGPPFREAIFFNSLTRPWGLTSIPLAYDPNPQSTSTPLEIKVHPSPTSDRSECILQAEPAKQLVNLKTIPILIVTSEASYHAMYDHCFVEFLIQAGCANVEHLELAKVGIHGNAHLMFLEKIATK
jgi:pimeloyl-ACP methyl ester carboxylesterase